VAAASLAASNFLFDQTPVTNNAGTMTISDGAVLPLSGIINNTGIIALDSIGKIPIWNSSSMASRFRAVDSSYCPTAARISSLVPFRVSRSPMWTTRSPVPASSGLGG
jgi:hypothetical protein